MKNETNNSGPVKENEKFSLPVGPRDLCFDVHEFLETTFSVDKFLHNHRKKANLEIMRDDLGVYLKILRSAMIELINKDYADFVNLSSNLIGLDKAINGIQIPLGQLREEVLQVKTALDDCMNDVSEQLDRRRQLYAKKYKLQSLSSVRNLLRKLKFLLQDCDKPLGPELVERASSEYNRLQFAISKCGGQSMESSKEESEVICNILTSNLNKMFLDAAKNKNVTEMAHCLRIYVTLDKISYAEDLFRKEVVASSLTNVISESFLISNPDGLRGIYSLILKFIDENMHELLSITTSEKSKIVVAGFDFLVNSYWTEVEQRLEVHLPSIYAPGNPEMFYQRYCETVEFLNNVDKYCGSQEHINALHMHPQYSAFIERWNLPVYFQIRFQEIAGSFETVLSDPKANSILSPPSEFRLHATSSVWKCLMHCWADGIFLAQLGHRFWKLSLQLLARYNTWIGDVLPKDRASLNFASESNVSSASARRFKDEDSSKMQFFVSLHLDVEALASQTLTLEEKTLQKLNCLSEQNQLLLKSSFEESKQQLLCKLPAISQCIIHEICENSLFVLRQVSDIPRLYRRTNRESPSKPCAYVAQALAPSLNFLKAHSETVNRQLLLDWLTQSFSTITTQYYSSVNDVLTSVQKTEESLRRLKKIRDRNSASNEPRGGGDDDKIRKQLALDVQSYSSGITEMGLKKENIDKLEELLVLVDDATKVSLDSVK